MFSWRLSLIHGHFDYPHHVCNILIRRFSLIHQETFEVFFQVISVGVQGEKRTDSMSFLIAQLQAKTE